MPCGSSGRSVTRRERWNTRRRRVGFRRASEGFHGSISLLAVASVFRMPRTHTVRAGETIARIALRYGFRRWQTVWEAPENEELRSLRASPDVLQPSDSVAIPDKESHVEEAATGKRHTFEVVARPKERLVLFLQDVTGAPLAGVEFKLWFSASITPDADVESLTGPDGKVDVELPFGARDARLLIQDRTWKLMIGDLDPVADPDDPPKLTGVVSRLANLAHGVGITPNDGAFAIAAAASSFAYRQDKRLDDNEVDSALRHRLRDEHRS